MTAIKAQADLPVQLERRPLSAICKDFVEGYCTNGDACWQSHKIVHVEETPIHPTIQSNVNFLSLQPRLMLAKEFDEDGPGHRSINGPRHNNDFERTQDIRILPTTDEILCLRRPYMPPKNTLDGQHLPPGKARLFDQCFRHLRYEVTSKVTDICYNVMQRLVEFPKDQQRIDYQYKLETPRGNQFAMFRNVAFEEIMFNDTKGAIVRLSYDCPRALQKFLMHKSNVMEDGMLCALIGYDDEAGEVFTIFFEVHQRESTFAMESRTHTHSRAAVQLSFADRTDTESVRRCAYYKQKLTKASFAIVDFPSILLTSFYTPLDRIQKLCDAPDIAFIDHLAPTSVDAVKAIHPPAYTKAEGYEFKLGNLQRLKSPGYSGEEMVIRPTQLSQGPEVDTVAQGVLTILQDQTSLDEGQAKALYENLSREIALTHGPPGTGKTFLGVALCQVILASQQKKSSRPILAVCHTNHALDDFLQSLLDVGVNDIVRLGSSSKNDWTKKYLLSEVKSKTRPTQVEGKRIGKAFKEVRCLSRDGLGWAESISNDTIGWEGLRDYLITTHPAIFGNLSRLEKVDPEVVDLRRAKKWSGFAYEYWLSGGDLKDVSALFDVLDTLLGTCELPNDSASSPSEFKARLKAIVKRNVERVGSESDGSEIWSLNLQERQVMVSQWVKEVNTWKLCEAFAEVHRRHQAAVERKRAAYRGPESRCLETKSVVGMTTNGCARNWEMLDMLQPRVVLHEEASEILEAHTLCSLLSSVQHAIYIGDPLQLRPRIDTRIFSVENEPRYGLDQSLFERLMFDKERAIPSSQLNVQRRMHPDIADIMRAGDYPFLKDTESTMLRPIVSGLVDRLYWLDHQQPEDRADPKSAMSKSKSNKHEVDWIAELVRYLIEQQGYSLGDITIITPYNGQLAAIASRLQTTCCIRLTEQDRIILMDKGLLPDLQNIVDPNKDVVDSTKAAVNIADILRIATVDNYQGEESEIIILSTVRSNLQKKVGFLKTQNRVNVACSRARCGFYIIGDAKLMSQTKSWERVVGEFKKQGRIGTSLRACCSHHTGRVFQIRTPQQFREIPSCSYFCRDSLPCGHSCPEKCHPAGMHEDGRIVCCNPCSITLSCGHSCTRRCSEPCGKCQRRLDEVVLTCGHSYEPTCAENIARSEYICNHPIDQHQFPCGHVQDVICSATTRPLACSQTCGEMLECGHTCTATCGTCKETNKHADCTSPCNNTLKCEHLCQDLCHMGKPCMPCKAQCEIKCQHGSCNRTCGAICDPCVKTCDSPGCEHQEGCETICSLPCTSLPCNEPCGKPLRCGLHICPGLCSETCLSECSECALGSRPGKPQIALQCGHVFDVAFLDKAFNLENFFKIDANGAVISGGIARGAHSTNLQCPQCSSPVEGINRYKLLNQLPKMSDTTDRFYAKMAQKVAYFAREIFRNEEYLMKTFDNFCGKLKFSPLAGNHNQTLVWDRPEAMLEAQGMVTKFRDEVALPFEASLRQLATFFDNAEVLHQINSPFKLRCDLLYFRCRVAMLEDGQRLFHHLKKLKSTEEHVVLLMEALRLKVSEQSLGEIKAIEPKVADAKTYNLKRLEAELIIVQLCFHLILKGIGIDSALDVGLKRQRIRELCARFPETAGMIQLVYDRLAEVIEGRNFVRRIHCIWSSDSKQIWHGLTDYKIGGLKVCTHCHPYSGITFTDCPECGTETVPKPIVPAVNHEAKLASPDQFMAAYRKMMATRGAKQ